jgi:hypothetical protein
LLASSGEHEINAKTILEHFVFADGTTREFEKNNTISRLWWIGDFFYSAENILNPFYLLDEVSQDINMYVSRCMTVKLFNNKKLLEVLILTIKKIEDNKQTKINRDLISKAVAYLNCLGGTYSLDIASKEFLEEKLTNYFMSIIPEKAPKPTLSRNFEIIVETLYKCDGFTTWNAFCQMLSKNNTINHKTQKKVKRIAKEEVEKEKSDILKTIKIDDEIYISLQDIFSDTKYKNKKNEFINTLIASLTGDAKLLYNIISSIRKQKFTKDSIEQLNPHFKLIYGNDFDMIRVIENGTKVLVDAGIISINGDMYINNVINLNENAE